MRREYFASAVVGLAVVALVAAVGNRLTAQEVEKDVQRVVILKHGDADDDEHVDRIKAELELKSDFWIGAMCAEADEALRSQLGLKDGNGLVVLDVVPDSPAAKAGLKKHDVIVSLGDKPLGKVSELVKAVDAATKDAPEAEKAEIELSIQRGGKSETVSVKPEKRKDGGNRRFHAEWVESPLDLRVVKPGLVLSKGAKFNIKVEPFRADLPEDMTVTITKKGKEPAKIVVKQGDKTWETTADKMGELPEEVRKHVEPMTMALPFHKGDRDVVTFMPNTEELYDRLRKATDEHRRAATEALEKAHVAMDKAKRQAAERGIRYLEEGKRIGAEQISQRLDDLARQIDALRKSVEQLKSDSKKE